MLVLLSAVLVLAAARGEPHYLRERLCVEVPEKWGVCTISFSRDYDGVGPRDERRASTGVPLPQRDRDQTVYFSVLDVYHKSPDLGERQYWKRRFGTA